MMQHWIIMIVVGLVAGWLAGQVVKGRGLGPIGDIVVGILGAILMGYLLPVTFHVGLPVIGDGGILNSIIWSAVGAIILLLIARMVKRA